MLVEQNELDPIVQMSRHEAKVQKLLNLIIDEKQLQNFSAPVHLTQGAPGTGKSYLGVVFIRALLMICAICISVDPVLRSVDATVCRYWQDRILSLRFELLQVNMRIVRRVFSIL